MNTIRFLRTTIIITLLVPFLNVGIILLVALRDNIPYLPNVLARLLLEGLLVAGILSALRQGRYPTLTEFQHIPRYELILSAVLCLLVVSLALSVMWFGARTVLAQASIRQRIVGAGVVVVSTILWIYFPTPAPPARVNLQVEANTSVGLFVQQHHVYSQGGEAEMIEPGYFERAMNRLKPLRPKFIRIDHIYDYYNVYRDSANGTLSYNWTELDRVIDAILAANAKPFICLSYMPTALARDGVYGPPKDFEAWETLVYETVYHLNVERGLKIQYWEVWNEPNLPQFWTGTLDEYLQLYEATVSGARRADASIKIGGPATASLRPEESIGTLFFEQNWISALAGYVKAHDLPLDFLSWHYYDSRPDNYAWSVHHHKTWMDNWGLKPELLITEWNRSSAPDLMLDSEVNAVYAAGVIGALIRTPLSRAFFFEPIDSSKDQAGRWGLMRADGHTKPIYNTFFLSDQLAGDRLPVLSDHTQVGILASRFGSTVNILIWHPGEKPVPANIAMTSLPNNAILAIKIYGIDAATGSLNPIDGEELVIQNLVTRVTDVGTWSGSIFLPANSVRLVKVTLQDPINALKPGPRPLFISPSAPHGN